jgi:AcrR family transcriptional regulator
MPRPPSPETRRALIEHAAELLSRREPVTLRSLARAAGVSTMAIYTYFDGMGGLWGAVRQEGFERLRRELELLAPSADPVRGLAALGVIYQRNALAHPALYRVMFDSTFELLDPAGADAAFAPLVEGVIAARDAGRFSPDVDPQDIATRYWTIGHGLASLAVGGVMAVPDVQRHAIAMSVATFVAAGDEEARAERSVRAAWRGVRLRLAPPSGPHLGER